MTSLHAVPHSLPRLARSAPGALPPPPGPLASPLALSPSRSPAGSGAAVALRPGPSGVGKPRGPMPAGCRSDPRSAEHRPGACAGTQVSARGRGAENLSPRRPAAAGTPHPRPRQPASPPRRFPLLPRPPPPAAARRSPCQAVSLLCAFSPAPPASAAGGRDWDFLRSQGWGRGPLAAGGPGL